MAWLNPAANAPTDFGVVQLTGTQASPTALYGSGADAVWLTGLWIINTTDQEVLVTILDASGNAHVPGTSVPPRATLPLEAPFKPMSGIKGYATLRSGIPVQVGVFVHSWGQPQA